MSDTEYFCYWRDCQEPATRIFDSEPMCQNHYVEAGGE